MTQSLSSRLKTQLSKLSTSTWRYKDRPVLAISALTILITIFYFRPYFSTVEGGTTTPAGFNIIIKEFIQEARLFSGTMVLAVVLLPMLPILIPAYRSYQRNSISRKLKFRYLLLAIVFMLFQFTVFGNQASMLADPEATSYILLQTGPFFIIGLALIASYVAFRFEPKALQQAQKAWKRAKKQGKKARRQNA